MVCNNVVMSLELGNLVLPSERKMPGHLPYMSLQSCDGDALPSSTGNVAARR